MNKHELLKANNLIKSQRDSIIEKYGTRNIGVGFKTEDGHITEKIAIVFYVNKNDTKCMSKIKYLPDDIEGIPTDVVVMEENFKIQ